jgi:hypothetical protein
MTAKKTPTANGGPVAARDFNDAGTGRSFVAGKPIEDANAGEIENYRAAGLLRPDDMSPAEQIVADAQDAA